MPEHGLVTPSWWPLPPATNLVLTVDQIDGLHQAVLRGAVKPFAALSEAQQAATTAAGVMGAAFARDPVMTVRVSGGTSVATVATREPARVAALTADEAWNAFRLANHQPSGVWLPTPALRYLRASDDVTNATEWREIPIMDIEPAAPAPESPGVQLAAASDVSA